MVPYFSDAWLDIYQGDVRDVLPNLPADSVDCIVTSPPYWGLRDYGTASWVGGEVECDHKPLTARRGVERRTSTLGGGVAHLTAQEGPQAAREVCPRCGATRSDGQLGLERTPEEYVENMVSVFRELRRVLKPSGTCWLNLGDSYASSNGKGDTYSGFNERYHGSASQVDKQGEAGRSRMSAVQGTPVQRVSRSSADYGNGMKPKDLVGIPWRVAFALQADGWYLRSDIIWAKPNPMPESVTDRPTKSHEYLFLLTRSPRYYFDADAVREAHADGGAWIGRPAVRDLKTNGDRNDGGAPPTTANPAGRNLRSVWTIATKPYPGAHFAVFPPELPERCIKAGSPELGTVLDPFAGSGTTGMVANRLSRRAILIDLNGDYLKQQLKRNAQTPLGLGTA